MIDIYREFFKKLISETNNEEFEIEFLKKDGTIKKMTARYNNGRDVITGKILQTTTTFNHDNYINVFDVVAKKYKNVNLDSLYFFSKDEDIVSITRKESN